MCADPTQSTNPLDCAFANDWITEADHRTGRKYARIYNSCGFRIGSTTSSAGSEVDVGSELTKLSLSQMSDEVICAAWDTIMARPIKLGLDNDGALLEQWNAANRCLSAAQRQQVYLVCVMDSWPQWIVQRLAGKTFRERAEHQARAERRGLTDDEQAYVYAKFHSSWERARDHLVSGLAVIRSALRPPAQITYEPLAPAPRPPSKKRQESTVYVDEDGAFIREVVRLVPVDTAS